jgi:hypothetical protein
MHPYSQTKNVIKMYFFLKPLTKNYWLCNVMWYKWGYRWFWTDNLIYCILWFTVWLCLTVHCFANTSIHTHVFTTVTPLSLSSRIVPCLSDQHITATAHNNCTPWLTDWLTVKTTHHYIVPAQKAQNSHSSIAVLTQCLEMAICIPLSHAHTSQQTA